MNFPWAYTPSLFKEGEWYESCNEFLPAVKIIKRCNKTIVVSDGIHSWRMRTRKGWNDCEYAFHYTSSKSNAYWATLKTIK